jgi:four helix bundle protein
MNYDLEERTTSFGEKVIRFAQRLPNTHITRPLITQLIEAGTSIGANYREANEASSKKDFRNKIFISKKESNETNHWLRLIAVAVPQMSEEAKVLWSEAHEFTLIFGKIISSTAK